jgi:hypothetical protein
MMLLTNNMAKRKRQDLRRNGNPLTRPSRRIVSCIYLIRMGIRGEKPAMRILNKKVSHAIVL